MAAVLVGVGGNRPRTRLIWWWLAAGRLLFVVGDLLFDLHERVWHTDAFPSVADGLYLSGYIPLAIGQAVEIIDRLRLATPLAQSFSAGVARWHGGETSGQIVARTDHALCQAKEAGRNRVLPASSPAGRGRVALDLARLAAADRPAT